jgi:RNA 2',3'-cyclic 3'-phosphodiesterase
MRAFLGLSVDSQTATAIADWRKQALPDVAHSVATENFHITLAFLGQINLLQQQALEQLISTMPVCRGFSVTLNTLGHFPKAKVLWLGCSHVPQSLAKLAAQLATNAIRAGIPIAEQAYQPHLSLYRKCSMPLTPSIPITPIKLGINNFHLFESVSSDSGVRYLIRRSWPLLD